MPSPFPGMDPYLEAHWRDVHASLVIYTRDALQDLLPPALRARVEERVAIEKAEGISTDEFYPDIRVVEYRPDTLATPRQASALSVIQPLIVEDETEPLTETYVEVIDTASGNKVVTQIEILSPTNKTPGPGLLAYKKKQHQVRESDTSLVEIDLLRGGHVLAIALDRVPADKRTPYMACVRRAWAKGQAEIYSIPLEQPLPKINVPLRQTDEDVALDLQALLDLAYRRAGYDGTIDYNKDAAPPLTGEAASWADGWLRTRGARTVPPPKTRRKRPPRDK